MSTTFSNLFGKAGKDAPTMNWGFYDIFNDTGMEQAFHDFLTAQVAEESNEFIRATNGVYLGRITQIVQTFIAAGSPREINISFVVRADIVASAARMGQVGLMTGVNFSPVTGGIRDARREVFNMMQQNYFAAFKKSDGFKAVKERRDEMRRELGKLKFR